ncbi:MAG: hypothetical protein WA324_18170 [Bryobacteraceae bacterium]
MAGRPPQTHASVFTPEIAKQLLEPPGKDRFDVVELQTSHPTTIARRQAD